MMRQGGRLVHLGTKALAVLAALLCSGFVWAGDVPDGNKLVRATVLSEYLTVVPGQSMHLGIRLEMEKGWHTYWKTSGESGLPVRVRFEEIEGVSFGELRWPAPDWHLGAGDVLDYIYEGTVVLLMPVTIDASATPGTSFDIRCKVDWLVCKELCVPGSAAAGCTIEVGVRSEAGADAPTIRAAREAIPKQLGGGSSSVRLAWRGAVLEVHCPGADGITLFLHDSEETAPLGPPTLRSVDGDRLRVPFDPPPDQYLIVSGVITVDRGRERASYDFALPGPTIR